ncbi:MAG: MFS transporter [Amphritea sp.]|nr:MFS transporter [Amphritea sp.]
MNNVVWLIGTAQTLLWGALYYLFPALLLHWEEYYGWSRAELTLALAIAVVVSAIFAPYAGRLIDKGKGPVMQPLSALIGAVLLFCLPYANSLTMFYLIWALIGVTMAGCLYEACFAFIIRHLGDNAKRAITLITLMAGFASTICFPLADYLARHYHVNTAVQLFALSIALIAVPAFWIGARQIAAHKPDTETHYAAAGGTSHNFLRQPTFWLLAASFSLLTINHGVILNHLLPILADRQIDESIAILAIAMIGPMQVLGRIVWMAFDSRFSVATVTLACFAGMGMATLCLIFSSSALFLLIGFVALQGASYGVISIIKPLITRDIMGNRNFGAITGAMALPYLICFAASPYIGSLIWQWQGYDVTLWVIWGLAIAALSCLLLTLLIHRRQTVPDKEEVVSLSSWTKQPD